MYCSVEIRQEPIRSQTVNLKERAHFGYVGKDVKIILKMDLSGSDYSLEICP
jgi:hypothetical protein